MSSSPAHLLRALLARTCLAVMLLFAQQHATLHWLSHAIEATNKAGHVPPPGDHCDQCAGLTAFGAAMTSLGVSLPASLGHEALSAAPQARAVALAPLYAYLSRAPPALS